MSTFGFDIAGFDSTLAELDGMRNRIGAAAGSAMLEMAQRVREVAIEEITAHARSAPGEPPASRTGRLADSIVARLAGEAAAEVAATADYAKHLEFGTRKMAPHAFLALAIAIVAPEFGLVEALALHMAADRLKGVAPDLVGLP